MFASLLFRRAVLLSLPVLAILLGAPLMAQTASTAPASTTQYRPFPAFDTSVMDQTADPCQDFYRYACGNFSKQHPIPSDQSSMSAGSNLQNVVTERLRTELEQYSKPDSGRTSNEQKIGDFYAACMDTDAIERRGLEPIRGLLGEIDRVSKPGLPYFAGELQRFGVNAFFGFGPTPSFIDSTQMIGSIEQGGLGLPERDYYTRTGPSDGKLRDAYVDHVAKMLVLVGEPVAKASTDARNILKFETLLAEGSLTATEMRDPKAIWHPTTMAGFQQSLGGVPFAPFFEAIHAPQFDTLDNMTPKFFPVLLKAIFNTDLATLQAYLRYQLATAYASQLPKAIDDENFRFYGTVLTGAPQQRARWKRCSQLVDGEMGEALGQIYVAQYFPPDSKTKTVDEVKGIEAAMGRDLDGLDWMSPDTKAKAKEKLGLVANHIGYPDKWRDYSKLGITADDAFGNLQRARAFENDREMDEIGKPVDRDEWSMSPPTVNAYYAPEFNSINFPAGILQPPFFDPSADIAVDFGHVGAIIGHELTHGFDDEGSQFDGHGNLTDWWTPADKQHFQAKTACLVNQYGSQAVGDLHVNGKLTLGENTADNGGLLLAYMAYMEQAKNTGADVQAKTDGFTGVQRFLIAYAQNWCQNARPEAIRQQMLTDPHSPDQFRASVPPKNTPAFREAFSCKAPAPATATPDTTCRVW